MKISLSIVVALCWLPALSQQPSSPDTTILDKVEITATSGSNKSLLYQPLSIAKLGAREIKRGTGLFFDDAINGNVPGVTMNRRGVSSGQQFNIRGYGNGSRGTRGISSNFDGQGYKVYLNGIPVTDAEGITVLDDIDFGSVSATEIIKGPAGSLYGLAIAGVVNLNLSYPESPGTEVGQDILIGNYGLRRYTTRFSHVTGHSAIMANYGHQLSDGFTLHNTSRKDFVNISGHLKPDNKQTVSAYFSYSNSYDERSGELTISQYDNNDFSGNIEYIKRNAHSNVYSFRAGLAYQYAFSENISAQTVFFGSALNSNASSASGWTDKLSLNVGLRNTVNTKINFNNNFSLSGITGVETQRQNAQMMGFGMIKNPIDTAAVWKIGQPYYIIGASNSNVYTVSATTNVFTEWTLGLPKDISLIAGVGYAMMKIKLEDRFYAEGKPLNYDTSYTKMFSPHFAVNKVFNKRFSVYASYSTAYKAPVSSYFYIPFNPLFPGESGVVNKNLRPERGLQWEAGTKGLLLNGKLDYQLALFNAVFTNKMTTVAVPFNATTTLYSYVANGGKQHNRGMEATIKYNAIQSKDGFINLLAPYANAAYSDFKYENYTFHTIVGGVKDSVIDYSNKKAAGVPDLMTNVGIDMDCRHGIYGNVNWLYKDGFPITSDNLNHTSSYNLLNAKAGVRYRLQKHFLIDVYFGVSNITSVKYPIMIFINQLPDAYIAGPPKPNYFGGLNLKFEIR